MDSLRLLPIVGLLALIPVAVYALDGSPVVVLSLVSVVIIVASLYYLFSPVEEMTPTNDGNDRDEGPSTPG
ncbi:MAG: hypothetical protein V5A33_00355 [Halobacteriales archaeon]